MSFLGKKWIVKNTDETKNSLEKIIENRGMIDFDEEQTLHDPFLFSDMGKAIERISEAIEKEERIIVFGDYDVDGITGTAILFQILKKLKAKVSYRLPHRVEDGYGLSAKFIKDFMENHVKLLITTDCGISSGDIITKAKEKGIDTIITDHHTIPKKLPSDAVAILHPKEEKSNYPFSELTGAGVALKLAHALIIKYLKKEDHEETLNSFMDLASMGTIADMGSLTGENRVIVKKGLEILANTKWIGLRKIMNLAAIKNGDNIDSTTVGFRIAPRINAAGRIGDPYIALSLLLQEDANEKVDKLGKKLEELNSERRLMTAEAMLEAENRIKKYRELPEIIIDESPKWHVGILGLIAGRLVEKHVRPAIIMQDFGDMLVASARSADYFNIIEAITACGKHLVSFGGHAQAAGFSIKKENLAKFKKEISAYAKAKLKGAELKPSLEIDCEVDKNELSLDLFDKMEGLKPHGIDNVRPTFLLKGVEPLFVSQVGKEKDHLKFSVKIENRDVGVIAFRMGEFADSIRKHKKIDMVFYLDKNRWNNKISMQFQALDFRESRQ